MSCNCCGQRYVAAREAAPADAYVGNVELATLQDVSASRQWDVTDFFVLPKP